MKKISGIATDSQGKPFTRVSLSEEVRGLGGASFRGGPNVTVGADGSFTALSVTYQRAFAGTNQMGYIRLAEEAMERSRMLSQRH